MAFFVLLVLSFFGTATVAQAADLCVKTGGSDATAKASISYVAGNEAGSTCWATIGRAAWGSTTRSSPNSGEAAAAGDTVYVFGGTYHSSLTIDDRFGVLYDPANDGSSGSPITFVCLGDCTLTCPTCKSPVLGSAGSAYIWWTVETLNANPASGDNWVIVACQEDNIAGGVCPGAGVATAKQDTGPVVMAGTGVVVEGLHITGYAPINPTIKDNWPGIRIEGCTACIARNNYIRDIVYVDGDSHATCFQVYNTINTIVEHNDCGDSGSFLTFKDNLTMVEHSNTVRFNKVTNGGECLGYSLQGNGTEDRNWTYQNVFIGCSMGANLSGSQNDWFFNNTIVGTGRGLHIGGSSPVVGGFRFWGNIVVDVTNGITNEDVMPATSILSLQHNVYQHSGLFYSSDGDPDHATLASFVAAHTTQETESPAGIVQNPLFADSANGDYRLCTGSGTPAAGCGGASPALALSVDMHDLDGDGSTTDTIPAGAYITGNEVIGINANGGSEPEPQPAGGNRPLMMRRGGVRQPMVVAGR